LTRFSHGPDFQGINPFSDEARQRDDYIKEQAELSEGYQESIQRKLLEPGIVVASVRGGIKGFTALIVSSTDVSTPNTRWAYTWDLARPGGIGAKWIVAGTTQEGEPGIDYGNATDGFLAFNLAEHENDSEFIAYGAERQPTGYTLVPLPIKDGNPVFIVKTIVQGNVGIWFEASNPLELVCDKPA